MKILSMAYEEGVRGAIAQVLGKKVEHVVLLDAEGIPLWKGSGTEDYVNAPAAIRRGNTVVHNHPSGASFSVQDIVLAIKENQREVIAVGTEYIYRLRRNGLYWVDNSEAFSYLNAYTRDTGGLRYRWLSTLLGATYEKVPTEAFLRGARFVAGSAGVQELWSLPTEVEAGL